jgi:hypothetical protein
MRINFTRFHSSVRHHCSCHFASMAMGCGVSRIVGDGMLPRMLLGSCTWRGCPCLSLPVASRAHSDRLCGDVTCRWRFTPICSERRHRNCGSEAPVHTRNAASRDAGRHAGSHMRFGLLWLKLQLSPICVSLFGFCFLFVDVHVGASAPSSCSTRLLCIWGCL